jgi:hypothetical protein
MDARCRQMRMTYAAKEQGGDHLLLTMIGALFVVRVPGSRRQAIDRLRAIGTKHRIWAGGAFEASPYSCVRVPGAARAAY